LRGLSRVLGTDPLPGVAWSEQNEIAQAFLLSINPTAPLRTCAACGLGLGLKNKKALAAKAASAPAKAASVPAKAASAPAKAASAPAKAASAPAKAASAPAKAASAPKAGKASATAAVPAVLTTTPPVPAIPAWWQPSVEAAIATVGRITPQDLVHIFPRCIKTDAAVVPALRQLAHAAAALAAIPSPEKGRYAIVFLAEHQYRNSCFLHALKFILGIDIGNQSPLSVVFGLLTAMTSESSQIDDNSLRHLRAPGPARPPWASLLMGVSHPLYSVGVSETLLEGVLLALNPPGN
jgi:hypothetical protein